MYRGIALLLLLSFVVPIVGHAETEAEKKKRIEAMLMQVERQIFETDSLVKGKQEERQSLERDLDILDGQIRKAQLGIQARALAIEELGGQIEDKELVIEVLTDRLEKQRKSLAELIRQTQSVDDYSLIEIMLSNKNFSDFFTDVESFRAVKNSLNESLNLLTEIKQDTQLQVASLEEKQLSEAELKRIQELEKQTIEARESEKEEILEVTKGEEERYQELLASQRKTAGQLRAELFQLLGGGGQIPLPEAVRLAQAAQDMTGTPASLILAILKQETDLGGNLGSCVMSDTSSGQDIMHPDRDKPVYLAIAETLGINIATQQVSCPLRRSDGSRIGWGGAMGPSQFIPSTWAIYGGFVNNGNGWEYNASRDAIRILRGKSSPGNPFDNQDAFLATALLLRDNGATGSYAADRMAALRYYAGWGGATNPENGFYGDGVMRYKAQFESDMRTLADG